ncbi:MAG: helix-turn-helix transcriptional regulator [Bacteroidaceae bacterium]|nr:helix-turn-helix transcriptional regulator [Bacteroidaceae bacterium]
MTKNQVTDPIFPQCPVRNVISRLGDKWSALVLLSLDEKHPIPLRYKDLQQAIPDISQKMLSLTLQALEADGMVTRQAYAEVPPRVEYTLTPRALSFMPHLHALVGWAIDNLSGIVKDREAFKNRKA